jgi:hypothetical protein
MRRRDLEHLIRAAADIADDDEIIVIGSQAILGQYPDAPADLCVSSEADVYPKNKPDRTDLIDGSIGEGSPFHATYACSGADREGGCAFALVFAPHGATSIACSSKASRSRLRGDRTRVRSNAGTRSFGKNTPPGTHPRAIVHQTWGRSLSSRVSGMPASPRLRSTFTTVSPVTPNMRASSAACRH